jgi:hypothetical protein
VKESPLWVTASASYCLSAAGLEIENDVRPKAAGNAPLNLFSARTAVFGLCAVQDLYSGAPEASPSFLAKPSKTSP